MLLSAAIVLVYTFLGGLTSAIYNEVLQFFLIVLGFAPLAILAVTKAGGWAGMRVAAPAGDDALLEVHGQTRRRIPWASRSSAWSRDSGSFCRSDTGARTFWWCSARWPPNSMSAARRTPLIAAFPKMFMPFIVILPGIAALALTQHERRLHAAAEGRRLRLRPGAHHADGAVLSVRACWASDSRRLMASFMSGMAGNVTAFNTVFTYDIYQSYIRRTPPTRITSRWAA